MKQILTIIVVGLLGLSAHADLSKATNEQIETTCALNRDNFDVLVSGFIQAYANSTALKEDVALVVNECAEAISALMFSDTSGTHYLERLLKLKSLINEAPQAVSDLGSILESDWGKYSQVSNKFIEPAKILPVVSSEHIGKDSQLNSETKYARNEDLVSNVSGLGTLILGVPGIFADATVSASIKEFSDLHKIGSLVSMEDDLRQKTLSFVNLRQTNVDRATFLVAAEALINSTIRLGTFRMLPLVKGELESKHSIEQAILDGKDVKEKIKNANLDLESIKTEFVRQQKVYAEDPRVARFVVREKLRKIDTSGIKLGEVLAGWLVPYKTEALDRISEFKHAHGGKLDWNLFLEKLNRDEASDYQQLATEWVSLAKNRRTMNANIETVMLQVSALLKMSHDGYVNSVVDRTLLAQVRENNHMRGGE